MNLELTDIEVANLRYALEWLGSPTLRSIQAKLVEKPMDGPVCEEHRQAERKGE